MSKREVSEEEEEGLLAEIPGNQKFMISRNETNLIQIVDGRVGAGTVRGTHSLRSLSSDLGSIWVDFLNPEYRRFYFHLFIFISPPLSIIPVEWESRTYLEKHKSIK